MTSNINRAVLGILGIFGIKSERMLYLFIYLQKVQNDYFATNYRLPLAVRRGVENRDINQTFSVSSIVIYHRLSGLDAIFVKYFMYCLILYLISQGSVYLLRYRVGGTCILSFHLGIMIFHKLDIG